MSYQLKKDPALRINLERMQCIFIFALKGSYLAIPNLYPSEIVTICLLPELLPLLSSNQSNLFEFIVQQKTSFLSLLPVIQLNKSFLNKVKRLFLWNHKVFDINSHLLKRIPDILATYIGLMDSKSTHSIYQSIVESSMEYIQELLLNNQIPTISYLAKRNYIKPHTLDLAFKAVYNTTAHKKIKSAIFYRVAMLLSNSEMKLLEISLTFGYTDTNTLNRIFKKIYGETMGNYRKNNSYRHFSK